MTLGKKISELRKVNNYSQEDLSKLLNVSRQTISKWETDMSLPDIERIKELSIIFNVSVNELLGTDENEKVDINELKGVFDQLLIINKNYEQESKKLKKRQRDIACISVITIVSLCLVIGLLFERLHETDKKIDRLNNTVNNTISNELDYFQSSITNAITNAINDGNAIISDFIYQIDEINLDSNTAKVLFKVAFKKANDSDKVNFIINHTSSNHKLDAYFNGGYYEYCGDILLEDIKSIGITIQDPNQTRAQTINLYLDFPSDYSFSRSININANADYSHDSSQKSKYTLKKISISDKLSYDYKQLQSSLSYLKSYEQDNEIEVIGYDKILFDRIEYTVYYKDKIISNGDYDIGGKEKFSFDIETNQELGNFSKTKVCLKVYTTKGREIELYKEYQASTTGLIGFKVINDHSTFEILE